VHEDNESSIFHNYGMANGTDMTELILIQKRIDIIAWSDI